MTSCPDMQWWANGFFFFFARANMHDILAIYFVCKLFKCHAKKVLKTRVGSSSKLPLGRIWKTYCWKKLFQPATYGVGLSWWENFIGISVFLNLSRVLTCLSYRTLLSVTIKRKWTVQTFYLFRICVRTNSMSILFRFALKSHPFLRICGTQQKVLGTQWGSNSLLSCNGSGKISLLTIIVGRGLPISKKYDPHQINI